MRPKKTRYAVRGGTLLIDGQTVDLEPGLVALVLAADGYPDIEEASLTEETAHRILRIRSSLTLVRKLEDAGLVPDPWVGILDEDGDDFPETSAPAPLPAPVPAGGLRDDLTGMEPREDLP